MSKWVQLPAFISRVEAYQAETGENHLQIAERLGVSLSTFRNWLYGQKTPGFKAKQRAALLFGCDVNEFIDNGGADRPTSVDLTTFSEIDRYRFDQIIKTLGDERLSDNDRQMLFEDLRSRANWVLSLKAKKD
jgi:transcriptional regulator with XRE-family HTH domain